MVEGGWSLQGWGGSKCCCLHGGQSSHSMNFEDNGTRNRAGVVLEICAFEFYFIFSAVFVNCI